MVQQFWCQICATCWCISLVACGSAYVKPESHVYLMTADLSDLLMRGWMSSWWAALTFLGQRLHLYQGPEPDQELHLKSVDFPTASGVALLQNRRGLCCEHPNRNAIYCM